MHHVLHLVNIVHVLHHVLHVIAMCSCSIVRIYCLECPLNPQLQQGDGRTYAPGHHQLRSC